VQDAAAQSQQTHAQEVVQGLVLGGYRPLLDIFSKRYEA
jgi:hypothetical protein